MPQKKAKVMHAKRYVAEEAYNSRDLQAIDEMYDNLN